MVRQAAFPLRGKGGILWVPHPIQQKGECTIGYPRRFRRPRVFDRLIDGIIGHRTVAQAADRYQINYYVKKFYLDSQLRLFAWAQIKGKKTLRAIQAAVQDSNKVREMAHLEGGISLGQLSNANNGRDYRAFADIYKALVRKLRTHSRAYDATVTEFQKLLRLYDSTSVMLNPSLFKFIEIEEGDDPTKCGIKIHVQLLPVLAAPGHVEVTRWRVHDSTQYEALAQGEEDSVIDVGDRAYTKLSRMDKKCAAGEHFVFRLKAGTHIEVVEELPLPEEPGNILSDQIVRLGKGRRRMKHLVRLVTFRKKDGEMVMLVTDLRGFSAQTIALIYKVRWDIELFFKWIKQHLNIHHFWGRSLNAVMTQVYVALFVYVAIRLYQLIYEVGRNWSLLRVFRHLKNTLDEELPLAEAFWLRVGVCARTVSQSLTELPARAFAVPN